MNVLVLGSGGREHALVWKIRQSPRVKKIYCIPGNGGIAPFAECVEHKLEDHAGLIRFAKEKNIDLTIVGPEAPLVSGIIDDFTMEGLRIFGPTQKAARLEGSKVFAKEFMQRWNIPTAYFQTCRNYDEAQEVLSGASFPLVVKADGLAAGKGVVICQNRQEAEAALTQIMKEKIFAAAGNQVVLEEFLVGEETSVLAVSDGINHVLLESCQDHKRVFDDDKGPNTGGMGAYSPAPVVTPDVWETINTAVIEPTLRGMDKEGCPFRGVLYAGLMITADGPKVLEYNVRFGDPETQAILPRLKSDLVDVLMGACSGDLDKVKLAWDPRACVCVVMSSGGYPGDYEKGKVITGIEAAEAQAEVVIFHAGTKAINGHLVTSGGRVLGVVGLGKGVETAMARAYQAVERIHYDRRFFRRDIGGKALQYLKAHGH